MKFEGLESERLLLRQVELSDAKDMLLYKSIPEINNFLSIAHSSLTDIEEMINSCARDLNEKGKWFQIVLIEKSSNRLIGDIGLHFIDQQHQCEMGYTMSPEFQSQGYTTEAVKCVLNFLFQDLNKHRVTALIDPDNYKSEGLLLKLGFRLEGLFKKSLLKDGVWLDDKAFAILQEEWL